MSVEVTAGDERSKRRKEVEEVHTVYRHNNKNLDGSLPFGERLQVKTC